MSKQGFHSQDTFESHIYKNESLESFQRWFGLFRADKQLNKRIFHLSTFKKNVSFEINRQIVLIA